MRIYEDMYNKLLMFIVAMGVILSGCFYEPVRSVHLEPMRVEMIRPLPRRIVSAGYRSSGTWTHVCEPSRRGHYVYSQCYWIRLNEYSRY